MFASNKIPGFDYRTETAFTNLPLNYVYIWFLKRTKWTFQQMKDCNYCWDSLITKIFQIGIQFIFKWPRTWEDGCNKKAKHAKFSEKRTFPTLWYAHVGVRNVRFSENLACFAFLLPPFWYSPFWLITYELL